MEQAERPRYTLPVSASGKLISFKAPSSPTGASTNEKNIKIYIAERLTDVAEDFSCDREGDKQLNVLLYSSSEAELAGGSNDPHRTKYKHPRPQDVPYPFVKSQWLLGGTTFDHSTSAHTTGR